MEAVTPCVGVWIEIDAGPLRLSGSSRSLPAWECGLKLAGGEAGAEAVVVTPCVGVWIEIPDTGTKGPDPLPSLPAWECGLK